MHRLHELRARKTWRGVLPSGLLELDRMLPDSGLAFCCLHEVVGGGNGAMDGATAAYLGSRDCSAALWSGALVRDRR